MPALTVNLAPLDAGFYPLRLILSIRNIVCAVHAERLDITATISPDDQKELRHLTFPSRKNGTTVRTGITPTTGKVPIIRLTVISDNTDAAVKVVNFDFKRILEESAKVDSIVKHDTEERLIHLIPHKLPLCCNEDDRYPPHPPCDCHKPISPYKLLKPD